MLVLYARSLLPTAPLLLNPRDAWERAGQMPVYNFLIDRILSL